MFNDQKLLQWFFGLLDAGASAIIMGWGVVEKREAEMGGFCVLSSLGVFSSVLFFTFCPHTLTRCWTTWVYHREGGRRVGCFLRAGNPNCHCSPKSPPTLLRTRHQGVRRALAGYQATLFKDTFKGTFQRHFSKALFKYTF